jgi:hypothetical protein
LKLTAYKIPTEGVIDMPIVPAGVRRAWMKEVRGVGACLPISIANQAGWWILNPVGFEVYKMPGNSIGHLVVSIDEDMEYPHIMSHFGYGILTVSVPYVFRTDHGWNLLFRGPSNYYIDGMQPYEGLVETDWHHATATMNWRVTREESLIRVEAGEPLCQIVPIKRYGFEDQRPTIEDMPPDLAERYLAWKDRRLDSLEKNIERGKVKYEGDYVRSKYEEHQRILGLREFEDIRQN